MKYHERANAILASDLPQVPKLLLLAISHYIGAADKAWPAVPTIARRASVDPRTAYTWIRRLQESGVLVMESRPGRSTVYRIDWQALRTPDRGSPPPLIVDQGSEATTPDRGSGVPLIVDHPTPDRGSGVPLIVDHPNGSEERIRERSKGTGGTPKRATDTGAETTQQPEPEPELPGWLQNPPKGATPPAAWLDRQGGGDRTAGRLALWDALAEVVKATRGSVRRDHMATDARELLGLLRALDWPPLTEWTEDAILVAGAMQTCPHPLFARDVRGIGWEGGVDRRHNVSTLAVHKRWADRLAAARAWVAAGGTPGVDAAADAKWRQIHAWANRPSTQDQALRATEASATGPLLAGLRAIGGIDRLRVVTADDMLTRRAWSLAYSTAALIPHAGAA